MRQSNTCHQRDARGISSVIGVVLMVAIVVVLASIVGGFALGMGDALQQPPPQAHFSIDYDNDTGDIIITHTQGKVINASNIEIVTGESVYPEQFRGEVKAGDTATINENIRKGETVEVVWTSDDGSTSSILAEHTFKNPNR